jgi:hypothetical protein
LIIVFAFTGFSGIIATILGKSATLIKVAGRERRVHHSKSLPLLRNGERFFFNLRKSQMGPLNAPLKYIKNIYIGILSKLLAKWSSVSGPGSGRATRSVVPRAAPTGF